MRGLIICFILVFVSLTSFAEEYVPGQVLVRTRVPIDHLKKQNALSTLSNPIQLLSELQILSTRKLMKPRQITSFSRQNQEVFQLSFDESIDVWSVVHQLRSDPDVIWAQPNFVYRPFVTPDDTYFASQQQEWSLINAETGWDITRGDDSVIIAIIDTGTMVTHEDLEDKIWTNTAELNGQTGVDDDGNGKIDDIRGWDTINDDNNPMDDDGHGTHVAGIAGATFNNNKGIAGTCPNCKLMILKAGDPFRGFTATSLVDAITYATDNGARVINMSLGGTFNKVSEEVEFKTAVDYALAQNVSVVAAAGNKDSGATSGVNIDNNGIIPASFEGVIAVSAANGLGDFNSSFSNFGPSIDVMAPGTEIFSTYWNKNLPDATNAYNHISGTSMSSPIVAGTVGLMISLKSTLTTQNIISFLRDSAVDKGDSGFDIYAGYGLLDIEAAIKAVGPNIKFFNVNNDYYSTSRKISVTVNHDEGIVTSSITVKIESSLGTNTYTLTDNADILSYENSKLTIDSSTLTLPENEAITITVTATNGPGLTNSGTLSITQTNTLKLFGPQGETSPVLNVPNPFDPTKETTKLWYQVSKDANILIRIYSLNLELVKTIQRDVAAGPTDGLDTWDGRDSSGLFVPNGVYIMVIRATSGGEKVIRRNKIAVLRR